MTSPQFLLTSSFWLEGASTEPPRSPYITYFWRFKVYKSDGRMKKHTIFWAATQWFAHVEGFRDVAMDAIYQVTWIPSQLIDAKGEKALALYKLIGVYNQSSKVARAIDVLNSILVNGKALTSCILIGTQLPTVPKSGTVNIFISVFHCQLFYAFLYMSKTHFHASYTKLFSLLIIDV